MGLSQNLDTRILQNINGPNTKYDKFWIGMSNSVIPVSLATPITLFGLEQFNHLSNGKTNAYAIGGALAINTLVTFGLKYSIDRDRPYVAEKEIYQKVNTGPHSFPSGHTSLAFSTATGLVMAYPKWYVAVPAYLWAGSVGYSRMHLGVHYPSDVLAGAIIGTLSGILANKLNKRLTQ